MLVSSSLVQFDPQLMNDGLELSLVVAELLNLLHGPGSLLLVHDTSLRLLLLQHEYLAFQRCKFFSPADIARARFACLLNQSTRSVSAIKLQTTRRVFDHDDVASRFVTALTLAFDDCGDGAIAAAAAAAAACSA